MDEQPKRRPWPTPEDDVDRKLLDDVQDPGWHVIMVEADEEGPSFGYSIGLFETFGHPEIIVFGLGIDVIHGMINGIGELIREGRRFEDRQESPDVLEGYDVAFRSVDRAHYREYFGYGRWFYRGDNSPPCSASGRMLSSGIPGTRSSTRT